MKKLNGNAKWIGWIGLAILILVNVSGIAYNLDVTNEKIAGLTLQVGLMREDIKELRGMMITGGIPTENIFAEK